MASYLINELVAGAPLFVPDAYNQFSIGSADMPNGDDSIHIAGNVSTDYKAFVPAPTVTPSMFRSRDYSTVLGSMSIVFWVYMDTPTFAGNGYNMAAMFGVYNNITQATTNTDSAWHLGSALWSVYAGGTSGVDNKVTMYKRSASSGGGASANMTSDAIPTNTWTMVTMNPSQFTDGGIYLNDSATGNNWSSSGEGTFSSDSIADPIFSLGHYQCGSGAFAESRPGAWRIGKLSFHDHHLNLSERTALYNVMMGL